MSEIKIQSEDFTPPRSGRPPLADISKLAYEAAKNAGTWVSQVMTNNEANSAVGQLKRRGFQTSTSQVDADHREVYVLYAQEH